jgi:hypothetical protein
MLMRITGEHVMRRRSFAIGSWCLTLFFSVLTGFGFFAYLWSEPEPILHRRPARPGGPLRALAATAAAALLLMAGGWLLRSAVS